MNEKLSIQDALTQVLKENINLLKNGQALTDALFERANMSFVDRKIYEKAFVDANIGEVFAVVDIYNKANYPKASKIALEKINPIMQEQYAKDIVDTLVEAMKAVTKEERKKRLEEKIQKKEEQKRREKEERERRERIRKEKEEREKAERERARQERKLREKEEQEKALKEKERKKQELQEKKLKEKERKKREQEEAKQAQLKKQNQELAREHNSKGDEYFFKKDYDNALTEYNTVIRLDPNYAVTYYNRGFVYREKQDYDRAVADFTKCIELGLDLAKSYGCRADIYDEKGEHDKAIADYTKAIDYKPNDASLYNNRGVAYQNMGDCVRAIADYQKALELNPDHNLAKENLQVVKDYLEEITQTKDQPSHPQDLSQNQTKIESIEDAERLQHEQEKKYDDQNQRVGEGLFARFFFYSGRLNRKEYFLRGLTVFSFNITAIAVLILFFLKFPHNSDIFKLSLISALGIFFIGFLSVATLTIRRLHDLNRSGWWVIPILILNITSLMPNFLILTIVSVPIFIYLLFKKGTIGVNQYGDDYLCKNINQNSVTAKIKSNKAIAFFNYGIAICLCFVFYVSCTTLPALYHNNCGFNYYNQREYFKAITEYDIAIGHYPSYRIYGNRGWAHYEHHDYDKALYDFNQALEVDPDDANFYHGRGRTYEAKGNVKLAIVDYLKATQLDKNKESYRNDLQRLAKEQKK